jgi:hypothetical protein
VSDPVPPATPVPAPLPSSVRAITCPNCGGTVEVRAAGTTVSLICGHCGSTLDATSPDIQVIARANQALHQPDIPLGARGVLRGLTWEVVGYMEREDDEVEWSEYLLFNPYEGYAFLVDDGRRFSLGRLLDRLPVAQGATMVADGQRFVSAGESYEVRVTFVVGEFYWRVAIGDTVMETDFTAQGGMLCAEDEDGERTWTRLAMLDWGEAEAALGIAARRPDSGPPSPMEGSPYRQRLKEAWVIGLISVGILFVLTVAGAGRTTLATANVDVPLDGGEKTIVLHNVDLAGARNLVSIDAQAPTLDNEWVDIDYSLNDQKTQEGPDAYALAEYYEGSDSDGRWTEGNRNPDISLSSMPAGRYDLSVTLQAHRWNGSSSSSSSTIAPGVTGFVQQDFGSTETVPVALSVARGGFMGGNVLLGLVLIMLWPGYLLYQHVKFEARRAGFTSGDDD